MDFVEVLLHDDANGRPLTVEFSAASTGSAVFSVQVWKLMDDGTGSSWQPSLTAVGAAEVLAPQPADGHAVYTIPEIDTEVCNRLGVIITRLDNEEELDAAGTYELRLRAD
jgi:hypothetical protein